MIQTLIPLVDLRAQYREIQDEIDAAIHGVVEDGRFILGQEVAEFEDEFAAYVGARGAVGVASGTAALHLALRACNIGPGDEVITTAHTFMATVEAICQVGARPVFADIDPSTYVLDPEHVASVVTRRTRAVLPVHLYGHPADMDALQAICRRHGLWLVEDAAQAHGAEVNGRRCGSIGDIACFSFYPGKNLGAFGDAGAVTGNNPELLARVHKLRDHGRSGKYEHDAIGYAERLDAIQAAVLRVKLRYLDAWNDSRRSSAHAYSSLLSTSEVTVPCEARGVRHAYHLYVVRSHRREALREHLTHGGIEVGVHYPIPAHRQPAWLNLSRRETSLPHTELAAKEVLSLPLHPQLTRDQLERVVDQINSFER